jgi:tRNA dimethylallyltransferase
MKGLVIAGPTGVGKTALSIELAKEMNAEIISCDSMQVYKFMDIGTAKIKVEEMQGIKHHMIDVVEPIEKYNLGKFSEKANQILGELEKKNKNVILAGGTGLYIDAIVNGLSCLPKGDKKIRDSYEKFNNEELYARLLEVDKESANEIHFNNRVRLERALEVFDITGEKFSVLSKKNIKNNNYNFLYCALERERENLYERINRRVDIMFEEGLLQEAESIYKKYKNDIDKISAIGYKELFLYFEDKISLEDAKKMIKTESRRYAKRQFTWFKRNKDVVWFNLDHIDEKQVKEQIRYLLGIQ